MKFPIFMLYDSTKLVGFVEILDDGPHSDTYQQLMLDGDGILAPSIGDGKIGLYGAFPVSQHISNTPQEKRKVGEGVLDMAIRRARNLFDRWNDVTGFADKPSGYYYEILACIDDAVHCGARAACGCTITLPSEKEK